MIASLRAESLKTRKRWANWILFGILLLALILLGYVKKVVIADRLAEFVDLGFVNHGIPLFTDANARTATKREVRKFWALRLCFHCPTLGVEPFGLRKESRITMHDVLTHQHHRSFWNFVVSGIEALERSPADCPARGPNCPRKSAHR